VPALRRAGVEVTELALHLPGLDEVFHALTDGTVDVRAKAEELV
jgi:oleandomycin transport system ATP-binding protein